MKFKNFQRKKEIRNRDINQSSKNTLFSLNIKILGYLRLEIAAITVLKLILAQD